MDVRSVLPRKNPPCATGALLMKPLRAEARVRGARNAVFALLALLFTLLDFLIVGPTGWGLAWGLLCIGLAYTLGATIPIRTRLFRLLPTAAVLLAVTLAAASVPNSTPAGSPPVRVAGCHEARSGRASCTQPCPPARATKRPADSALDPCLSSPGQRDTLEDGAPSAGRGGA